VLTAIICQLSKLKGEEKKSKRTIRRRGVVRGTASVTGRGSGNFAALEVLKLSPLVLLVEARYSVGK
jgi:hypothetical protein